MDTFDFDGVKYASSADKNGLFRIPWKTASLLTVSDLKRHKKPMTIESEVSYAIDDCRVRFEVFIIHNVRIKKTTFDRIIFRLSVESASIRHARAKLLVIEELLRPIAILQQIRLSNTHTAGNAAPAIDGVSFFSDAVDEPLLRLLAPMLDALGLSMKRLFICHASEDKAIASEFGDFLKSRGANVWLDKWEIKVGDSIVQKVNEGLEDATHLAILFSANALQKTWVKREWSSALMRQLAKKSIKIIPVLIDDCEVPMIFSDIKYADCRTNMTQGFSEVLEAICA